jgi:glucose-6-phosphate 1-dehydrogenase
MTMDKATPIYRTVNSCEIEVPRPCGLIIFGASGDLTKRKLMPSLYHLYASGMLSEQFFILGTGRNAVGTAGFRSTMLAAVKEAMLSDFSQKTWDDFSSHLFHSAFDYSDPSAYRTTLHDTISTFEQKNRTMGSRIFYLAVPPTIYADIIRNLGAAGFAREETGNSSIVIEKPFGRDLDSSRHLNMVLQEHFQERQVYRIDHYLAKETVQNILMFRFANSIFEPLWNRRYIDHIQITASETLGVEHRAGYYEQSGVLRDMFQNHMFQLLAIIAMEPPAAFEAEMIRDEKVKVFRSIRTFPGDLLQDQVVIGQYDNGMIQGSPVIGYREEEGVSARSMTPTFAAMKVFIDNWRWDGVPFYLRAGKRLTSRKTEIAIHYKHVPHSMFPGTVGGPIDPNTLVLRVQPDEGMNLTYQTKMPGSKVCLNPVNMDYSYPKGVHLDAYEWVLLDCMLGDHMLFTRQDGVEQTWSVLSPVIEQLEAESSAKKVPLYAAGAAGPAEAMQLIEKDNRVWRPL